MKIFLIYHVQILQIPGTNSYCIYSPGSYCNIPTEWWQLQCLAPRNHKGSNNSEDTFVTALLVYHPKK